MARRRDQPDLPCLCRVSRNMDRPDLPFAARKSLRIVMERVVFWDVDTQVDFMAPGGKTYIKGAEEITENLRLLTGYARDNGIRNVGSVDYHTPGDAEISLSPDFRETFPPHCLRGTEGQQKVDA